MTENYVFPGGKKQTLTHNELLVYASNHLSKEIELWEDRMSASPPSEQNSFLQIINPLKEKLENIRVMYKIETGVEMN